MTSFLQSDDWMDLQKSLGRKVFDVEGAKIIRHELALKKNYLYIPYGPEIVSYQFDGELKRLAQQEQAIFIKAEPMQDQIAQELVRLGYQKSPKHIQPHRTVILDLTKSEDELLGAMHHKTRYNIRVAEREHVVVQQSDRTSIFWDLMKKTSQRDKFHAYPESYYHRLLAHFAHGRKLETKLWIASHAGKALAAAITLTDGMRAYYLHGASDYEHRAIMGPYLLHWRIIHEMKQKGIRSYDLWGIDAQKWPGVTRFKLGWGGRTIEYPGGFDMVLSSFWYSLYNIRQRIR